MDIEGWAFACPPIFSSELAPCFSNFFSISNEFDIITRLSFGSMKDLSKSLAFIKNLKEDQYDLYKKIKKLDNKDF